MSKTLKQTLKLHTYFTTPITILNWWVTLACFSIVFLSIHIIKENDRKHLPSLQAKLAKTQKERDTVLEAASKSKYQTHKHLGNVVGIMPKNKFFKESQLSFSHEMKALSKTQLQDTWLTSLTFNRKRNMMELKGLSITPKYIQGLTSFLQTSSAFDDYDTDDLVPITDSGKRRSRSGSDKSGSIRKYEFTIKNHK